MLKGVIFDVDGTLLDTEKIYMRAWREAGLKYGFNIPEEALLRTRAVCGAVAEQIFKEYLGDGFSYQTIRSERVRIAEEIIAKEKCLLKSGVITLLDELDRRKIPAAVASSTGTEKTKEHLNHAGILDRFTAIIGGDMVHCGKPNPDIFLLAAEKLERSVDACVVVEDSPAGIEAAYRGNIRSVLIPDCVPANSISSKMACMVLNNLDEFKRRLDSF